MKFVSGKLNIIKKLAAEGNYHIYSLLTPKKRVLLLIKLFLTTFRYLCFTHSNTNYNESLVFIKGGNQHRLYNNYKDKIYNEVGKHQVFFYDRIPIFQIKISCKRMKEAFNFIGIFLLIAVTGKRKYLNLFLLRFYTMLDDYIKRKMNDVRSFICFNDQPFDVVALILSLHNRNQSQTIVVQHGLILTEKFYFPTQARQFWGWGVAVEGAFQRNNNTAELIIKGRYTNDGKDKQQKYINFSHDEKISVLVAPSFFHDEVKNIIRKLKLIPYFQKGNCQLTIKYHPATKLKSLLRLWMRLNWPSIKETTENMEILSNSHHVLITKNSTSALDFMLKGKPVFFTEVNENSFPRKDYAFLVDEIECFFMSEEFRVNKNKARLLFLEGELNV